VFVTLDCPTGKPSRIKKSLIQQCQKFLVEERGLTWTGCRTVAGKTKVKVSVIAVDVRSCCRVRTADGLCWLDEVTEDTVLKAVQSKETAAPAVAVSETQSRPLLAHDVIEPSM